MAGLEEAAQVFEANIGGSSGVRERPSGAAEDIFGNSAGHETDLAAGGDDEPDPKVRTKKDDDEEVDPEALDLEAIDEDDEDDADPDAKDDDDEDDDSELMNKSFKVMVDGEETEVPLKEALQGYIRTQTFHQRLNALDGVKKELGTHVEKLAQDRANYDEMLAEAEELLKGILPQEPDWDKLFAEDPKGARDLQKQYQNYQNKIAEIRAKRGDASKKSAEKQRAETAEYAKTEYPKFVAIAKWKDKEGMQKDLGSMRKTAISAGFSEEEVAQVLDSRMLHVLLKASKYDRMMNARPKEVKKGKTPVQPGAGRQGTARRGNTGAQKRLSRSGSVEDAAAVMANLIK